jgi:5-methylcytosine-specific restriction protein A
MPNAPKKKVRPWVKQYKQHERVVDMVWFYNDTRWRKYSKQYKLTNPLCIECDAKGITTPTAVTDHLVRYINKGPGFNLDELKDEYFQPLCDACHNSKSGKEAHGYKRGMG